MKAIETGLPHVAPFRAILGVAALTVPGMKIEPSARARIGSEVESR